MFRVMNCLGVKWTKLAVLAGAIAIVLQPALLQAQEETFFTPRRYAGMAFIAGGLIFTYTGYSLRQDANDLYDRYKATNDPLEADRLYQRTSNRDIKSQVSWAVAAGLAISGVRLLLPQDDDSSTRDYSIGSFEQPGLGWDAQLGAGRVDLKVQQRFF